MFETTYRGYLITYYGTMIEIYDSDRGLVDETDTLTEAKRVIDGWLDAR